MPSTRSRRASVCARTPTWTPPACASVVDAFKAIVREATGRDFPQDPLEQLDLATKAVFASWFGKRAVDYRDYNKIAHDLGTAVNVVTMVFGNMGDDSGTGVAFTRDPNTGERRALRRVPHERAGRGRRGGHPHAAPDRADARRDAGGLRRVRGHRASGSRATTATCRTSSSRSSAAASSCSRRARASAPRSRPCASRRTWSRRASSAARRPSAASSRRWSTSSSATSTTPRPARRATRIAKGLNASPGAAVGRAVFSADSAVEWVARGREGRPRPRRDEPRRLPRHGRRPGHPDGSRRRHVARCGRRAPDRQALRRGLRGARRGLRDRDRRGARRPAPRSRRATGSASTARPATSSPGALATVSARYEEQADLQRVLGWADAIRRLGVWTNADKPEEAAQARSYGAEGIGLCRTEHMFREGERLEIVRGAILVAGVATRAKAKRAAGEALDADEEAIVARFDAAMAELEVLQQGDFEGIFRAMDGLPVVIRLDRPAAPRVPAQPRGAARQGHAGRGRRERRGPRAAGHDPLAARAEPDAGPAGRAPGPDDPRLREGPDARDPRRADRGQEGAAATRSRRS